MQKHPHLAAPFALMGLVGGWLTAVMTVGHGSELHLYILLTLFTPIVSSLLGSWLAARAARKTAARTLITILATIVAGGINGSIIGLFAGAMPGMMIGLVCGLMFSAPFIPGNLLVMSAAHRVGRAPRGSLVDGVDRRGVWRATALVIAAGSLITIFGHQSWRAHLACTTGLLIASAIAAFDLAARSKLMRISGMLTRFRPYDPVRHGECVPTAGVIHIGLGDERFDEIAAAESPYREADRVVRSVVGDPVRSSRALKSALAYDAIALTLIACALTAHVIAEIASRSISSCG
jgi:hypothetical protein